MPRIYKRLPEEERKARRRASTLRSIAKWRASDPEGWRESKRKSDAKRRVNHPEKFREHELKRYGITPAQYDAMVVSQENCCALCKLNIPEKRRKHWCVDHCHDTGVVRGLLCIPCNLGIGHFQHDLETLQRAIDYLKKFS